MKIIALDLKPQNILFKKEDLEEIALIDFGVSRIPHYND